MLIVTIGQSERITWWKGILTAARETFEKAMLLGKKKVESAINVKVNVLVSGSQCEEHGEGHQLEVLLLRQGCEFQGAESEEKQAT